MTTTDVEAIVSGWIDSTNTHDTGRYLAHVTCDAVLDDPSVAERFEGREAIAEYLRHYVIGYDTT